VNESDKAKIDRLLNLMEQEVGNTDDNADCALWHLLVLWKDRLPKLDGYFHKCFRQNDVTDSGHSDMAIWHLLYHSKLFWRLYEKVNAEFSSEAGEHSKPASETVVKVQS
jgi:hypothetical protein